MDAFHARDVRPAALPRMAAVLVDGRRIVLEHRAGSLAGFGFRLAGSASGFGSGPLNPKQEPEASRPKPPITVGVNTGGDVDERLPVSGLPASVPVSRRQPLACPLTAQYRCVRVRQWRRWWCWHADQTA